MFGKYSGIMNVMPSIIQSSTDKVTIAANQQERPYTLIDCRKIPFSIAYYIVGFVDGEGSFNISLRKKEDYRTHWQPVLSFNVSQKDKTLLEIMRDIFNCGIIKRRRDGLYSYDVTNPIDLQTRIIPFFNKFRFLSEMKKVNYFLFTKAVQIMMEKRHLTQKGLHELLIIREEINRGKGRKQKYTIQDVYKESPTTIRQAPTLEKI